MCTCFFLLLSLLLASFHNALTVLHSSATLAFGSGAGRWSPRWMWVVKSYLSAQIWRQMLHWKGPPSPWQLICRAYITSSRNTMPQWAHLLHSSSWVPWSILSGLMGWGTAPSSSLASLSLFTSGDARLSSGTFSLGMVAPLGRELGLEWCLMAKSRGVSLSGPEGGGGGKWGGRLKVG